MTLSKYVTTVATNVQPNICMRDAKNKSNKTEKNEKKTARKILLNFKRYKYIGTLEHICILFNMIERAI